MQSALSKFVGNNFDSAEPTIVWDALKTYVQGQSLSFAIRKEKESGLWGRNYIYNYSA